VIAHYGKPALQRPPINMPPYGLIVVVCSVALSGVYVFATEAARWSKALVVGLLALSFFWRYGLFLQVAVGVFLSLYFTYLEARSS
jgi:hypothetical protein